VQVRGGITAAIRRRVLRRIVPSLILLAACTSDVEITEDTNATSGASVTYTSHLSGCHGKASTTIPSGGHYDLTSFGGPGDEQAMSCGGRADGKSWYAASTACLSCMEGKFTAKGAKDAKFNFHRGGAEARRTAEDEGFKTDHVASSHRHGHAGP